MTSKFRTFAELADYARLKANLKKTTEVHEGKAIFEATSVRNNENQREDITAHCDRHGLVILRWEMVKGRITAFVYHR